MGFMEQKHEGEIKGQIKKRMSPLLTIILSFALVIFVGSVLLVLPFASSEGYQLSYENSLFLAVSAVCVTGLTPVVLATELSIFGKIVMALLIQIGGLGLVTLVSFVMFATGKRFNVSQAIVVKEALNQPGFAHIKPLINHILIITASFELLGTFMNMFVFSVDYPFWEALGISAFHAISSFNNAGFDIIGPVSLYPYKDNVLLNLSTCILIIAGGLGFLVYEDLVTFHKWKRFSVQTRIVLIVNLSLILLSILTTYACGYDKMTFMQAAFYAINLRTAGFTTFANNVDSLSNANVIFSIIYMFIGGSPLSTAGGIKTTTLFVIIASVFSFSRGKKTVVFKRTIDHYTKLKAFFLLFTGLSELLTATILISVFENDQFLLKEVIYECSSAFGTVGLTLGITPFIHTGSKIVLELLMFSGRLGPVIFLTVWNPTLYKPSNNEVLYLGTDLMVG